MNPIRFEPFLGKFGIQYYVNKGKVLVMFIILVEMLTLKIMGVNSQITFDLTAFIVLITPFRSRFSSFSEIARGGTSMTIFPRVLR